MGYDLIPHALRVIHFPIRPDQMFDLGRHECMSFQVYARAWPVDRTEQALAIMSVEEQQLKLDENEKIKKIINKFSITDLNFGEGSNPAPRRSKI